MFVYSLFVIFTGTRSSNGTIPNESAGEAVTIELALQHFFASVLQPSISGNLDLAACTH